MSGLQLPKGFQPPEVARRGLAVVYICVCIKTNCEVAVSLLMISLPGLLRYSMLFMAMPCDE